MWSSRWQESISFAKVRNTQISRLSYWVESSRNKLLARSMDVSTSNSTAIATNTKVNISSRSDAVDWTLDNSNKHSLTMTSTLLLFLEEDFSISAYKSYRDFTQLKTLTTFPRMSTGMATSSALHPITWWCFRINFAWSCSSIRHLSSCQRMPMTRNRRWWFLIASGLSFNGTDWCGITKNVSVVNRTKKVVVLAST